MIVLVDQNRLRHISKVRSYIALKILQPNQQKRSETTFPPSTQYTNKTFKATIPLHDQSIFHHSTTDSQRVTSDRADYFNIVQNWVGPDNTKRVTGNPSKANKGRSPSIRRTSFKLV